MCNFTFLSGLGITDSYRRAESGKNSYPVLTSASFIRIPSAGSGVSGI